MKIYNTLTKNKEEFKPIKKGRVGMYVCGPTVYDEPHIGHARSAYIFEYIRSYLKFKGLKVRLVKNVTDIDDKIIDKARDEFKGEDLKGAVKKVSTKYLKAYHDNMNILGIARPDKEPKATAYINKMKAFIQDLVKRGVAYTSGGDVYFDITKAPDYGKLSKQSIDEMKAGARISQGEKKRGALDFALWKKAKEGEPSWPSPWGDGRPGWHIECSVMSSDILGDEFDIHGGGIDLVFPHHENEIAQAEGRGKRFARYWIHNGLLTINGEKMAKSLGNFITIDDFFKKGFNAEVLKFFFLSAHYSQPIDFTWDVIKEKKEALDSIARFLGTLDQRAKRKLFTEPRNKKGLSVEKFKEKIEGFRKDFQKAMDDDFNTPQAIAVFFEIVRLSNKAIHDNGFTKEFLPSLKCAEATIKELGEIFGLLFKEEPSAISDNSIEDKINARTKFRNEKKFKEADQIRKELEEAGIMLEDIRGGKTTWRRKSS